MANLSDVAKAAGVSVSTASFVLNGRAEDMRISSRTAERVLEAVRELGYVPNVSARSLSARRPPNICLIASNMMAGDDRAAGRYRGKAQAQQAVVDRNQKLADEDDRKRAEKKLAKQAKKEA